jgi:hypothetical protein
VKLSQKTGEAMAWRLEREGDIAGRRNRRFEM